MMLHNTRLREGILPTGNILNGFLPSGTIISPYTFFNSQPRKEEAWESIRVNDFPDLPSRRDAIFLFENETDLENANQKWWPGEPRRSLQAVIIDGSLLHKADTSLLDCLEDAWESNARTYWSGDQTENPLFEVIVQGAIYFPEWKSFPMLLTPDVSDAPSGTE